MLNNECFNKLAVVFRADADDGIPVPDYTDENVNGKVVRLIQSYTGVMDKIVLRKGVNNEKRNKGTGTKQ